MATVFGHALTAFAMGKTYPKSMTSWKFVALGILCSILPDADVISFYVGIPYDHLFGNRGFFHSFLFAVILGVAFFSPWDNTRYFLRWRPIQISPSGIGNFFNEWGWKVIKSELIWIGITAIIYMILLKVFHSNK